VPSRQVSRSAVVAAPPEGVFDLLADPRAHPEFDGSGTVRSVVWGPVRLTPGARFGMRMRMRLPYVVGNTVVEFEENRRIAWRHVGRHVWRYQLEPTPEGGTRITETFDYAPSPIPWLLERVGYPAKNAKGIEATLERLQARFGTPAA
jgi:uncharacterized protein YndB with AHSA1/START domain